MFWNCDCHTSIQAMPTIRHCLKKGAKSVVLWPVLRTSCRMSDLSSPVFWSVKQSFYHNPDLRFTPGQTRWPSCGVLPICLIDLRFIYIIDYYLLMFHSHVSGALKPHMQCWSTTTRYNILPWAILCHSLWVSWTSPGSTPWHLWPKQWRRATGAFVKQTKLFLVTSTSHLECNEVIFEANIKPQAQRIYSQMCCRPYRTYWRLCRKDPWAKGRFLEGLRWQWSRGSIAAHHDNVAMIAKAGQLSQSQDSANMGDVKNCSAGSLRRSWTRFCHSPWESESAAQRMAALPCIRHLNNS